MTQTEGVPCKDLSGKLGLVYLMDKMTINFGNILSGSDLSVDERVTVESKINTLKCHLGTSWETALLPTHRDTQKNKNKSGWGQDTVNAAVSIITRSSSLHTQYTCLIKKIHFHHSQDSMFFTSPSNDRFFISL